MIAHKLDWDTEFFGYNIAMADIHTLYTLDCYNLDDWCRNNGIDCLYFLAKADDESTIGWLERFCAHLTDVRLTFARDNIKDIPYTWVRGIKINEATKADIPALRDLVDFSASRFFYDDRLRPKAAEMYRLWIEKSCQGYADKVFVARVEGQPAGYITCKIEDSVGEMILVGVNQTYQGQGIGRLLGEHALRWFQGQCQRVEVVTQGRNIPAQRLYQRLGFMTSQVQLWHHIWWEK